MKARHKDTGEIIELAEEGIISRDGRRFCWYQVELIPEPIDECKPSLPSNLDEAANNYGIDIRLGYPRVMDETDRYIYNAFKDGAKWMAEQFQKIEGELVDWYSTSDGTDYCCGISTDEAFEVPEGFYIKKK